jgi:hypothetical protein
MFVGGMDWFQDARLEGFQQKENFPHVAKPHDERKEVAKLWNPPNEHHVCCLQPPFCYI